MNINYKGAGIAGVMTDNTNYFNDEWFKNWKHRKPNEHLFHFNKTSLVNFMSEVGYTLINMSNIEDTIRKNNLNYSNIITGVFKKI